MSYQITTDINEMDFDVIHQFIANSYWAKEIPKSVMRKALENSLCFALFEDKNQIGFARMITDKATFAYLADVFILPDHQGNGLSRLLMDEIVKHPDLQGLRRVMLATRDAHGLYAKYGFENIKDSSMLMQMLSPGVYTGSAQEDI